MRGLYEKWVSGEVPNSRPQVRTHIPYSWQSPKLKFAVRYRNSSVDLFGWAFFEKWDHAIEFANDMAKAQFLRQAS